MKLYGGYPMAKAKKRRIIVRGVEVIVEAAVLWCFMLMALLIVVLGG